MQSWRQKWLESNKLYHYANYKHVYEVVAHVRMICLSKFRGCLVNFRSCAHNHLIEKGRYIDLNPEHRTCPYCKTCVEDECRMPIIVFHWMCFTLA